jgi:hypothetical protein
MTRKAPIQLGAFTQPRQEKHLAKATRKQKLTENRKRGGVSLAEPAGSKVVVGDGPQKSVLEGRYPKVKFLGERLAAN